MSVYANQKSPRAQTMGRQMGQLANPFQQNEGEDRNVEQQAVGQALRGESKAQPAEQAQQPMSGNLSAPGMIPVTPGMMPTNPTGNTGIFGERARQAQPQLGGGGAVAPPAAQPGAGARPAQLANPFLNGFDTDKLYDPNSGSVAGSKYTNDAKIFGQLYLEGTPLGRGNLDPMVQAMRGRGLSQATAVGDDKIDPDGPGPQPPIDVWAEGLGATYQNTTGNPDWERQYGGGGGGVHGAALQQALAGPAAPMGSGMMSGSSRPASPAGPLPAQQVGGAAPVPVAAGDWAHLGVTPAQAYPGMPLPGQPGKVLQHQNGGWVIQDQNVAPPAAPSTPTTPQAPAAPLASGPGPTNFRSVPQRPADTIYNPGELPQDALTDYNQFQFDQFSAPDQKGIESQQQALLQQILSNPHTMSDTNVAQLKEMNKEEALAMEKQLGDKLSSRLAGRGLAGGGMENASRRRMGEDAMQQILSGNRAVDLEKMSRDRGDELSALGAADDVLGNQMTRSTAGYGARLAGQSAQAGEGRFAHQAGMDKNKFSLERALAGEGLKQAGADSAFRSYAQDASNFFNQGDLDYRNRSLDVQRELGEGGLNIDRSRISEGGRQFDLSHQLALQEFAERMRQFNGQMGYNYNALTQNGQNALIQQILSGL